MLTKVNANKNANKIVYHILIKYNAFMYSNSIHY